MIDLVLPVGIVQVFAIGIHILVGREETECLLVDGVVVDGGVGAQHLGGIEAVLTGIHHFGRARLQCNPNADIGIDTGCHRVAALGLDQDDTIAALGTIERRGILHHRDFLDIFRVDVEQQVGVVANMERRTVLLHILDDTVDDNEWLCVGIQRVKTTYKHGRAIAGTAGAGDGTYIGSQPLFDVAFHGLCRGGAYRCRCSSQNGC